MLFTGIVKMIHLCLMLTSLDGMKFISLGSSKHSYPTHGANQLSFQLERAWESKACWRIAFVLGGIVSIVLTKRGGKLKALLVASSLHTCLGWGHSCLLYLFWLAWLWVAPYVSWLFWRLKANLFKLSLLMSFIVWNSFFNRDIITTSFHYIFN